MANLVSVGAGPGNVVRRSPTAAAQGSAADAVVAERKRFLLNAAVFPRKGTFPGALFGWAVTNKRVYKVRKYRDPIKKLHNL
jgi:hypothetical protein